MRMPGLDTTIKNKKDWLVETRIGYFTSVETIAVTYNCVGESGLIGLPQNNQLEKGLTPGSSDTIVTMLHQPIDLL
jgi:hypothetical protein